MKFLPMLLALLLGACSAAEQSEAPVRASSLPDGLWMADQRSGFCKAGNEAAFVIHAADGSNCMAQGAIERGDEGELFRPRGDSLCTFPLSVDGQGLVIGKGGEACDYYCAGSARLPASLTRKSDAEKAVLEDGGGDPICLD